MVDASPLILLGKTDNLHLLATLADTDLTDIPSDQAEISGDLVSILHEMEGSW